MLDTIFILGWILAIILTLLTPRRFDPADERYTSSMFQAISMLFISTGFILQRFAGLSTSGVALIMIPSAAFLVVSGFMVFLRRNRN